MKVPSGHRLAPALLLAGLLASACSDVPTSPLIEPVPSFTLGSGAAVGDIEPVDLGTLGGTYSFATDINDNGWIVGFAASAGDADWRAFRVTPILPMTDLLTGPGSQATGVNNNGEIVGYGGDPGFYWDNGVTTPLQGGSGCSTPCRVRPWAVSDDGVVVGWFRDTSFRQRQASWLTRNSTFGFTAQAMQGDAGGSGNDINNEGAYFDNRIVGQAPVNGVPQAALWPRYSSFPAQRGPLLGDVASEATALNDNSPAQIVGWSQSSAGVRRPLFHGGGASDAPTPLTVLAGFSGGVAEDINDAQIIVGSLSATGVTRAVIWPSPGDDPILLHGGADNPMGPSTAVAINEQCQVVGTITDGAGKTRAALWNIGGCDGGPGDPPDPPDPPEPGEAVASLIAVVVGLGESGSLSSGNTNALTGTLGAAQQSLANGNERAAANQLFAFINQVEAFLRSGRLSESEAADLTGAAQAIITQLRGE